MPVVSATAEFIVTIDGPAGTGKSTVAHRLARRLGLEFLDTGAMYRAAALEAIDRGISLSDGESVATLVRTMELRFDWRRDPPEMLVDGRAVGERIRTQEVTRAVSIVASNSAVRAAMVESQRLIASLHPRLVTEGRDQGSLVFPDADVRIYLDARPEIRARRRVDQLRVKGIETTEAEVLAQIIERDAMDSSRRDGPLICPRGADVVETSDMHIDAVVDALVAIVKKRAGKALVQSARERDELNADRSMHGDGDGTHADGRA